jgi:hypothetical protein
MRETQMGKKKIIDLYKSRNISHPPLNKPTKEKSLRDPKILKSRSPHIISLIFFFFTNNTFPFLLSFPRKLIFHLTSLEERSRRRPITIRLVFRDRRKRLILSGEIIVYKREKYTKKKGRVGRAAAAAPKFPFSSYVSTCTV